MDCVVLYDKHVRKLNYFHMTSLRRLSNIKWQDKLPDTEVLTLANLPTIYAILKLSEFQWARHVCHGHFRPAMGKHRQSQLKDRMKS